jgi:DNA gyrase inhibitor GyrI
MWKAFLVLAVLGVVVALFLVGCKATRAGYESAPYKVVRKAGGFEVRDYPVLTIVETPMAPGGSDGGFNRLFGFITGRNAASQKIAMTTPVFMSGSDTNAAMAFVMPAKLASGQVPKPTDDTVKVREIEVGRFAVFRHSGGRNREKEAEAVARLKAWMDAEKLPQQSGPMFGYFDPPWTAAFLRRNEVMIRTKPEQP